MLIDRHWFRAMICIVVEKSPYTVAFRWQGKLATLELSR